MVHILNPSYLQEASPANSEMETPLKASTPRFPLDTTVPIVIRSPVGGTDDVAVQNAQLAWNVSKLKSHICALHPQKPLVHEQRLIYGGRLLEDKEKLHEVLREFKPGETQFIHLVLNSSRRVEAAHSRVSSEGLRQRHSHTQATVHAQKDTASAPDTTVVHAQVQSPHVHQQFLHTNQHQAYQYANQQHVQYQAMQAMSSAQYYEQYANHLAAAGYSEDVVSPYRAYAQYYASVASVVSSPSSSLPATSPSHVNVTDVGSSPTDSSTSAGVDVHPVDNNRDDSNPPMVPNDVAGNNNFANAGHGARPAFPDLRNPPAVANNIRHLVLEQLALILKLAFFMFYFGSHVGGWRYGALLLVSLVTFLVQGGWIAARRADAANDEGPGVADVEEPNVEQQEDNANIHDNDERDDEVRANVAESVNDADAAPVDTGKNANGESTSDEISNNEIAHAADENLTNPANVTAEVPPPAEVSVRSLIGTILYTFFASLVPGGLQRRAENNA
eukprot:m.390789 g.390789  ORF g.390789 m.390789 type:complete len:503 (-) comp21064_c0_seq1:653-2161(-)